MQETDWRLDRLFRAVALFDQLHVLEEAIQRLKKNEWAMHEFNCQEISSQEEFLNAILHKMGILKQDFIYKDIRMIQFWDLLRGAKVPEESGLVLAFKHLDSLRPEYPEFFQELLQSFAVEHYYWLTQGRRFMACAHLADRTVNFEPLYTLKASWNEQPSFTEEADRKWEKKKRFLHALREARIWLNEHGHPNLRSSTYHRALHHVTGTTDFDSLADMNLDAEEMVRLLDGFDFESLEPKPSRKPSALNFDSD